MSRQFYILDEEAEVTHFTTGIWFMLYFVFKKISQRKEITPLTFEMHRNLLKKKKNKRYHFVKLPGGWGDA